MIWHSVANNDFPPDNTDVLGYTIERKYKVVSLRNGIWDTYMRVVYWSELPDEPSIDEEEVPKKKRGRPKKMEENFYG